MHTPPTNRPPSPSQVAAYPEFDGRGVAFLAEGDEEVCYVTRYMMRGTYHYYCCCCYYYCCCCYYYHYCCCYYYCCYYHYYCYCCCCYCCCCCYYCCCCCYYYYCYYHYYCCCCCYYYCCYYYCCCCCYYYYMARPCVQAAAPCIQAAAPRLQVCYMMREDARRLLHLPEHIFKLLSMGTAKLWTCKRGKQATTTTARVTQGRGRCQIEAGSGLPTDHGMRLP